MTKGIALDPVSANYGAIVVRLPSGITIELGDGADLISSSLSALATLEMSHAAAR